MIYRVTATLRSDTAAELRQRLEDGTIAAQRPDGQEIVDSLRRAVVTDTDQVRWTEECYCQPPLAHERATVLDRHFDNLTIEPIADHERCDGRLFMAYLATRVATPAARGSEPD